MRVGGWSVFLLSVAAVAAVVTFAEPVTRFLLEQAFVLFTLFKDESFPLLLAAAILAVSGSLLILYLLFVVLPKIGHLKRLRKTIDRIGDEEAFAAEFDSISRNLANSPLIGHAWKEYQETLVQPSGAITVVQNTTRPQAFLNYRCAQDYSMALRLMPHLPNYFVGIGLLLTFVGLVAALYFATESVGGDIDTAIEGLQNLLRAATFKFWTSIAGLTSSILLSFAFRVYSLWIESAFSQLNQALEERLVFSTPQRIFFDLRDAAREQLAETKKINTDMAMAISDGVAEKMKAQIGPAMTNAIRPLVDAVQTKMSEMGDDATDSLEQMVKSFAETVEGSAGQHLEGVSKTLVGLGQTLETTQSAMADGGEAFGQQIAEAAQLLQRSVEHTAKASGDLAGEIRETLGASMEGVQSSLDSLKAELNHLGQELQKQGQELARVSSESRSTADAMAQAAGDVRSGLAPFQETAGAIREATENLERSLADLVGRTEASLSSAQRLSDSLSNTSDSLSKAWEDYQSRFEKVDDDLERAFSSMRDAVANQQSQVQEFVQKLDASFDKSTSSLGGGIEALQSIVEELSDQLNKLLPPDRRSG